MGFGGAVQAMITSLKNNARKRKTLYDNKGYFEGKQEKIPFKERKTDPAKLRAFRLKLKKERQQEKKRNFVVYAIVVLMMMMAFIIWLSSI